MIDLDELEKGLVCLVPKNVTKESMLLSCHEYSVCDCKVLELISEIRKLREVNGVIKEALNQVKISLESEYGIFKYDVNFGFIDEAIEAAKIMGEE